MVTKEQIEESKIYYDLYKTLTCNLLEKFTKNIRDISANEIIVYSWSIVLYNHTQNLRRVDRISNRRRINNPDYLKLICNQLSGFYFDMKNNKIAFITKQSLLDT